MKTYTDIEQSKRLSAILDADTADLIYINNENDDYILTSMFYGDDDDDDVPCWSLGALFNQLPCTLEVNGDEYNPVMQKSICWSND